MKSRQPLVPDRSLDRKKIAVIVAGLAFVGLVGAAALNLTHEDALALTSGLAETGQPSSEAQVASLPHDAVAHKPIDELKAAGKHFAPYFANLDKEATLLDRVDFEAVPNPGIILVVTDTLRPDHLGAYGYGSDTSPFIDSLAKAGVAFTNHVSNSSWTKTSMASLLTGLYPRRHGVLEVGAKLRPDFVTLAEAFKAAGFATGAVIANKIAGSHYGLSQGFDFVAEPDTHYGGQNPHAGQVLATATRWLTEVKDKPYFLMVLLFDAHDPYYPPFKLRQKFCANCGNNIITTPQREYRGKGPTPKQVADMRSLYDGELRFIDNQLLNFYQALSQINLLDRTTLAILSDHGEAFGEHGVFEHAFHMWDEVVRTPLVLQGAGVRSQGYVATPTSHIDLYPTLLRLAGIDAPTDLQGSSLVQRPNEAGLDSKRVMITEVEMYGIHRLAVRDRQHKLVFHSPLDTETFSHFYKDLDYYPSVAKGNPRWEQFDLVNDPFEKNNLHGGNNDEVAHLLQALSIYQRTGGLESFSRKDKFDPQVLEDLRILGYVEE